MKPCLEFYEAILTSSAKDERHPSFTRDKPEKLYLEHE